MSDDERDFPATISEAVNRLLSDLPLDIKKQVMNSTEEDLSIFHFGLGADIRNEFGLWEKDSALFEDCKKQTGSINIHVDDASEIIIEALWKRLQEFPPRQNRSDSIMKHYRVLKPYGDFPLNV